MLLANLGSIHLTVEKPEGLNKLNNLYASLFSELIDVSFQENKVKLENKGNPCKIRFAF